MQRDVNVDTGKRYGMTTSGMLPQLGMTLSAELAPSRGAPDLVVVDFGVNDAYAIENAWAGLHATDNATASYAEVGVRRNRVQLYFNMSWTTDSGSETLSETPVCKKTGLSQPM